MCQEESASQLYLIFLFNILVSLFHREMSGPVQADE